MLIIKRNLSRRGVGLHSFGGYPYKQDPESFGRNNGPQNGGLRNFVQRRMK